jgi:hypothetical protein
VPFEETIRRHATRPQAGDFGRAEMTTWYRGRDLLPGGIQQVIPPETTLEAAVEWVMQDAGLDSISRQCDRLAQRSDRTADDGRSRL